MATGSCLPRHWDRECGFLIGETWVTRSILEPEVGSAPPTRHQDQEQGQPPKRPRWILLQEMLGLVVSYCFCNKFPQNQQLKTTQTYHLTALEVRNPKPVLMS